MADELLIGVPNQFAAGWLQDHYLELIREAIALITGGAKNLRFVVVPDGHKIEPPPQAVPQAKPSGFHAKTCLNDRYTFESFVVGDSNRFAHAAALAVAEFPTGNKFNPLYIYGGVGLGKTHLAQAIGNFVIMANRNISVLYVTSEKFTNDFINAISHQKTAEFAEMYRSVDVLVIDDIQFLSGKEATQIQFFHTFNALYQSSRQIVLTGDRPPHEIQGFEERLMSRFKCGLMTDIQPPDLETRLAILNRKIKSEQLEVPSEVAVFIADRMQSNIRELEGFLNRVSAFHSMTGREITKEFIQEILAENNVRNCRRPKELTIDKIIQEVGEYFNIPPAELTGKSKTLEVATARQVAMYLARHHTTYSLKTIGLHFGSRDHSTVIHSVNKVADSLGYDPLLRLRVDEILKKLKAD